MKTLIPFVCILAMYLATGATAQELLVGGNMEDSTWKVINYKAEPSEYEINYTGDGPSEGKGGCLRVTGAGSQETDIIFYQAVTLIGRAQYEFKGAFKDCGGNIANFWCEALYDTAAPPPADSGDFGGTLIVGFNTWNGTTAGIDGTFQDDFAKGDTNVFTAPGDSGKSVKVYIVIDVGDWTGGAAYTFDVAVDELSLKRVGGGTDVKERQSSIPDRFSLHQNYPNPFNPQTTISYSLPRAGVVTLTVYNLIGRKITTLVNNERKAAGSHTVLFDAAGLPSGVYFYRLQTENYTETKRMALIK